LLFQAYFAIMSEWSFDFVLGLFILWLTRDLLKQTDK
jgi:hypothetical protein